MRGNPSTPNEKLLRARPLGGSAVYLRHLAGLWFYNHTGTVSHSPKRTTTNPLRVIARRDPKYFERAAGALLLFSLIALLVACQGVSAGPSIETSPQGGSTLSLANGTLNFGNVAVGSTATLSIVATNSGPASVTVSSVSISSQLFQLVAPSLPVTVAAGQSSTVTVTFSPTTVGTFNATASIASNAANATSTLSLTGTGVTDAQPGQLSVSPATLDVGSVAVGSSGTASGSLTAAGSIVTIAAATSSNPAFTISGLSLPATIPVGANVPFTVTFSPTTAGAETATLTFTSNAETTTTTESLSGTGTVATQTGQLSVSPTTLNVGSVTVGSSGTASLSLSASGASVTVTAASTNNAAFTISGLTLPKTIAAGASISATVKFSPSAAGTANATLTFTSNGTPGTTTESLTGTGVAVSQGQLSVSPSTLSLGSVVVGLSGTASGSLSASGESVTVTGASTNNSVFTLSGLSLPVTIAAGQSVPFTVTFRPTAAVAVSATLSFASNATGSPTTEALTGTGTPAPVHSVNLSWTASTSTNISGYNIYRAVYSPAPVNACGSFAKINALLNTGTTYTDSNVTDGTAYCYAATAVNTSSQESGYSNIVSDLQIPPP
jgi:Abnormal spindle-like microcephaly-assoc'd, ASPM-SPD-2-Hydin